VIRLALVLLLVAVAPAQAAFTARTSATGTFRAAAVFPPRNVVPPSISGSRLVGDPLTADPGTWARAPQAFSFRWERETTSGWTQVATTQTYTPTAAGRVRVVVADAASAAVAVEAGWGGGLQGLYGSTQAFAFPRLTRLDPRIEFLWGLGSPASGIANDFAVRWTGRIRPRYTETYRLIASGNDPIAITVDGRTSSDGRFALEAGREHEIRLDLRDDGGGASARLEWESPRQARQVVPSTHLAPPGNGLRAELFATADLSGTPVSWVDSTVDFDWFASAPDVRIPKDHWSARWTGQVVPRHSDEYTFWTIADDGVRLWVDGRQIIDDWVPRPPTERQGAIRLEAGRAYAIRFEFFERDLYASASLGWQSARQPREVLPTDRLLPFTTPSQERLP
jgi:hypothetical protein